MLCIIENLYFRIHHNIAHRGMYMADKVLTYSHEYYRDNHSRRSSLMVEYKANMLKYLRYTYPHIAEDVLINKINTIVAERYKSRTLKYLSLPSPGNVDIKMNDLLETTNELNTDIMSPTGASYCQIDVRKSLFSEYIEDNQKERKVVKHEMLKAEVRGDDQGYRMGNLKQMNIKININVLSGVMLSSVTFRSAINYNAITSTARFGIMTAYSIVELAMASNYYFYSEAKAINWIINLLRIYPGDVSFSRCIDQYKLAIPSVDKVFSAYAEQVKLYAGLSSTDALEALIKTLKPLELAFVYYAVNMKRIFQDNDHFRTYFDDMLDIENVTILKGDIPRVAKLPDDVIQIFAVVVLANEMDKLEITDPKTGKVNKATLDDIDKSYPEFARKIYSVYIHLENYLKKIEVLFENLIMLPIVPSDIGIHKNMIRNMVLLSDTDSILFTNMNWIEWYSGNIHITEKSSNFNAALVTIISKFLEHVFAYMSASMNIDTINMKTLAIKNEFMYDLFLRTPISKHYAGYAKFREGMLQSPYKFDLKGKNFKGSDLCKETTTYVKWFIKYIFDSFLTTYELHPEDLITKAIAFEQRIKRSINDGEVTFLTQKPINLKQGYKIPESSNYLYYELWQDVFAEKYGDLNLPQKTKELPIYEISIKDTTHLNHMKDKSIDIYDKFKKFVTKYPKRKFSRVLIPMDIEVPEELRILANYRKVCSANCYSLDLILKSFNIVNYPNNASIVLFSDTYLHLLEGFSDDEQKRITDAAKQYGEDDEFEEDWDEFSEDIEED